MRVKIFFLLHIYVNYKDNYHCNGGTFIIYVRRSIDDCVVFITEERLGQMHLHLLSSYCA